ncbi:MAG: cation:proton antiporter regulatory subunit [Verrucomicrobiota bacterium]
MLAAHLQSGLDRVGFEELTDDSIRVPEGAKHIGRPLAELDRARELGVLICGIQRGYERTVLPPATATFQAGDRLLLIGSRRQLSLFKAWLEGNDLQGAEPKAAIAS